jgi:Holliday junction resolvase-like predicted endonuclease
VIFFDNAMQSLDDEDVDDEFHAKALAKAVGSVHAGESKKEKKLRERAERLLASQQRVRAVQHMQCCFDTMRKELEV